MSSDRAAQVLGAGLAALWLVVLISVDLAIPGETMVLAPLFAVAPLIACVVLPARATAAVAAAAVAATIASGWWNHTWGTAQHLVGVVDGLLVGGVAVLVAVVLLRQAQRHARVAEIAEVAQRTILPTLPSLVGQVTLAARYQSAAQDATVGGDLYDCYHSVGRVRFLVGDVRGKGIAAVEQSARVIRAFRQSAGTKTLLSTLAQDMSEYLAPFFDDEEFVTALLVDASEPTQITLVSCGHPPAMLIRPDGRTFFLEAPAGLPLGLGDMYDAVTVPWAPGDRLLMYTDGLSEARNVWGQFLDLPSLVPLLTAEPVEDALNAVLHAVRHHVPSGRLTDDLAVMLLENTAAPAAPVDPGPATHELPFPAGPGPTMTTLFPRTTARAIGTHPEGRLLGGGGSEAARTEDMTVWPPLANGSDMPKVGCALGQCYPAWASASWSTAASHFSSSRSHDAVTRRRVKRPVGMVTVHRSRVPVSARLSSACWTPACLPP